MMEHTTDRLFWTLTSVIVGALILTIGVKAFPNVASSALTPMQGVMKQADVATGHVGDAANSALHSNNGNSNNNSNTDQQSDAEAKANAKPYNPAAPASGVQFDRNQVGFNIAQDSNGNGVLHSVYVPQSATSVTLPEYVVYQPMPWVKKQTIKIVGVDGGGNNILAMDNDGNNLTALTTINLPKSIQYIGGHAFDNDNGSANVNRVTVNIPKTAQIQKYAFGMNPNQNIHILTNYY